MTDLSIVIPCYNEVENVGKLRAEFLPVLHQLLSVGAVGNWATKAVEVIFVDDGSTDGTLSALQETFADLQTPGLHFRFAQHRPNRGLGAALRTGFDMAHGAAIITTDSDGAYHFSEIPVLLARLTSGVDIVTASPYHPEGTVDGVPTYRLWLSRGASAIYRLLTDRSVYTYTALFRAYRREVIQNVPFYATGFLAGTELLVNSLRMGYRVAEHPTVLHSRAFGVSKAQIMRTIKAHLGFQLRTLLPWHPYGLLIRGAGPTVYLVEHGRRRAFLTPEAFLSHGYQWQQIVQVRDADLQNIPEGPP
ncbi:MAG: glycosyltransferase family 2 protein [Caldilineaceae bacterium]